MIKKSGEAAMQEKMREVFQAAGKELKFWKEGPLWKVIIDGKRLGENHDEATAFQKALDASGIGGKILYTYNEKKGQWVFKYTPKI